MASEGAMFTYAGRLASFVASQPNKRRTSTAKKSRVADLVWPHQSPAPEQLARAGFYYKPSATNPDSVTCFLCSKALDGWETTDDPAVEHLAHVPDCGWAINMGVELRSDASSLAEEDPRGTKMIEARRATFADQWPHEGKKGWKCKVQKMVDAGWCYEPLPEADDCVKCFYCGVCLDGWEPKDDPWVEHERRSRDCPFFIVTEQALKASKIKPKVVRQSARMSRSTRLSTQTISESVIEIDATTLSDNKDVEEDNTVLSTTSQKRKAPKGRKRAPTVTRSTKGGHRTNHNELPPTTDGIDEVQNEMSLDITNLPSTAENKKLEHVAAKIEVPQTIEVSTNESLLLTMPASSPPSAAPMASHIKKGPKKKGTKKMSKTATETMGSEFGTPNDKPAQAVTVEGHRPKRAKQPTDGDTILDSSLVPHERPMASANATRTTRGKKRTSDGNEKTYSSILAPAESVQNRGKITSRNGTPAGERMTPHKMVLSSRSPQADATSPHKNHENRNQHASNMQDDVDNSPAAIGQPFEQPASKPSVKTISPLKEEHMVQAVEWEAKQLVQTKNVNDSEPQSPPAQSSDAENIPPSSAHIPVVRHGSIKSPINDMRNTVLSTPATPLASNKLEAGLESTHPWLEVDLEKIFLLSPRSERGNNAHKGLEDAFGSLSAAEKQMSIGDWIMWNAKKAEGRLKDDCERLINVFEQEGVRALQTMEGIQCG